MSAIKWALSLFSSVFSREKPGQLPYFLCEKKGESSLIFHAPRHDMIKILFVAMPAIIVVRAKR